MLVCPLTPGEREHEAEQGKADVTVKGFFLYSRRHLFIPPVLW